MVASIRVPAAEAAVAVAPSAVPTVASGEEEAASSVTCWRMRRRKEDTCSAVVGGATLAGLGTVPTSIPASTAEAAVAVGPSSAPTITSGEGEAARVATADAVGITLDYA